MLTVGILRDQLASFSNALPVRLCVVTRSGAFHDRSASAIDVVDAEPQATDGNLTAVWLTGASPVPAAPALVRLRCSCGDLVLIDDHEMWPEDHQEH